ncbi:MFS transporter [Streptomyces sp. NBC_01262]|uniref:MFS transporter n=1 Tax=Streptomyces sp. NBC_01262 TaxID=2903803 RepID=UPI002E2ED299|nr:MFS transporter [Streptomyces sp. NBC_01262]
MSTPSGAGKTGPAQARPDTGSGSGDRSAGYRSVFAVREFRFVFAADVTSMLGRIVCELALAVLVYRLTGSPLLSALTWALGMLPYVVGGTLLSSVADRFPPRRVLVVCDLVCAGCAAGMVVPGTPVAVLLALRCATAVVGPVFGGTRAATLGDILGDGDRFVLGRSLLRLVAQSAQLVGFAAGGLLIAAVSPRSVLGLTVVAFLGSGLLLLTGTKARPARQAPGGARITTGAGLRRLLADRRIRALLLLCWMPPMFVVWSEALMTPYADSLGLGPAGLGLLMTGMPVGAVTGELLVGSLLGPRGRARLTLPVAVLSTLPPLAYAFHPGLGWALLVQFVTGWGITYSLGLDKWFIDAVPEGVRGQAMTLMTAGMMTTQGLGMALAGVAAEFLPVHVVVAGAGVVGTVCVTAVVRSVWITDRTTTVGVNR